MCTETLRNDAILFVGSHYYPAPVRSRSLTAWVHTVVVWRERAKQRKALLGLDERLLSDIGVTKAQAITEARKPFWKP